MSSTAFLTVKDLSDYLMIKPSTLYSWAAQRRIPHYKVNGLLRFKKNEIDTWIEGLRSDAHHASLKSFKRKDCTDVDFIIASAKKEAYTIPHGKPGPIKVSGRRSDGTL